MASKPSVKCVDYRGEQLLLGIRRQLQDPDLAPEERRLLEAQAAELEKVLGLD